MTPHDHASEAEKALAEVLRANGGGTACAAWIYNHGPALLAEVEALRKRCEAAFVAGYVRGAKDYSEDRTDMDMLDDDADCALHASGYAAQESTP